MKKADGLFEVYTQNVAGERKTQAYTGSLDTCKSIIEEAISDKSKTYIVKVLIAEKLEGNVCHVCKGVGSWLYYDADYDSQCQAWCKTCGGIGIVVKENKDE